MQTRNNETQVGNIARGSILTLRDAFYSCGRSTDLGSLTSPSNGSYSLWHFKTTCQLHHMEFGRSLFTHYLPRQSQMALSHSHFIVNTCRPGIPYATLAPKPAIKYSPALGWPDFTSKARVARYATFLHDNGISWSLKSQQQWNEPHKKPSLI